MAEPAGPPPTTRTSHDTKIEGDSEAVKADIVDALSDSTIGGEYTQDAAALLGCFCPMKVMCVCRSAFANGLLARAIAEVSELC